MTKQAQKSDPLRDGEVKGTEAPFRSGIFVAEKRLTEWLERSPFVLVVTVWSLILSVVLTWPALLDLGGEALGYHEADTMKHLWTIWWIRTELLSGHLPFTMDLFNYPTGIDLFPIEPLNGLFAALLAPFSVIVVSNVAALINLTATGVCAALLGRKLSGNVWGGLAAGILLQGSAIAVFSIHAGIGEFQHLWWLPLGLLAWQRLRDRMDAWGVAAVAGALAGATLSCFYLGCFLAIGVSVLSLSTLWAGPRTGRLLACYAVAAALALLVVVPVVASFSASYSVGMPRHHSFLSYVFGANQQASNEPLATRLDPTQLVLPRWGDWASASSQNRAYGGGRYMGWLALVLALAALVRVPRRAGPWAIVAGVAIVLALGNRLVWNRVEVPAEWGLNLPYFYLNRILEYLAEGMHFPVRFVALAATGIAALAAVFAGTVRRPAWIAGLALLSIVEVRANQLNPVVVEHFNLKAFEALDALADGHHPTMDLTFALNNTDPESRRAGLAAQIFTGQPMQAVPIERVDILNSDDGVRWVTALPLVTDLLGAFGDEIMVLHTDPRPSLALLLARGFTRIQYVGNQRNQFKVNVEVVQLLSDKLGPPLLSRPSFAVWDIPEPVYTEEELVTWQAAHTRRIQIMRRAPEFRSPADSGRVKPFSGSHSEP